VHRADATVHGVKIDVQGMEVEALEGMRDTLTRWRPWVVVELRAGVCREEVVALMREAGYSSDAIAIEPTPEEEVPLFLDNRSYAFQPD
jgi:hypothetical protein